MVSKMAWGNGWTFIKAVISLKICILIVSFCLKHIMFQLENFGGIMCHDTEGWGKIWRKTDSWLEKWHKVFGYLVSFPASSQKSENFNFGGLLLSKGYKVLDEKVQKSYVSWHWLLVPKMTWGIWQIFTSWKKEISF